MIDTVDNACGHLKACPSIAAEGYCNFSAPVVLSLTDLIPEPDGNAFPAFPSTALGGRPWQDNSDLSWHGGAFSLHGGAGK